MAARTWFNRDNTSGLDGGDLRILNCAARNLEDQGVRITTAVLTYLRTEYRPGMCADDLISHIHRVQANGLCRS